VLRSTRCGHNLQSAIYHLRSAWPRALGLALLALALLLAAWHLGRFATHTADGLGYAGPLDGQEGTLLFEARLILRGEPLYQPLRPSRVVGAPYPPIHAYALAAAEELAGGAAPIFRPGRLISLAGMAGAALLLGLIVWRLARSLPAALLAPALFLATPPAQLWATRIKPDPLALLFTAAGLLCAAYALAAPPPRRRAALVAAAALYAAAFFTKQTQVAAPVATGLALLLRAEPPDARWQGRPWAALLARRTDLLTFALSYLGIVGAAWRLMDAATSGQFSFHVWGLHPPEWWLYGRFLRYAELLLPGWPLLALALAGGALALRRAGRPGEAALPLAYAALGSATLVGAGTIGSHHNHLLEPYMALTLGGCAAAGWLLRAEAGRWTAAGLLAASLLLLQAGSYLARPDWYGGEFDLSGQDWRRFVALIQSQPGEVLSDDVGLLLLAGKEPRYDDPPTMGPAARSGIWDQSGLLADVRARRFSLVLLQFDATSEDVDAYGRWSPEFIAALRASYRLLYRDRSFSYVPAEP
jgi:hypothetical protein